MKSRSYRKRWRFCSCAHLVGRVWPGRTPSIIRKLDAMSAPSEKNLLGLGLQELTVLVENLGEPGYRGRQLFEAIYQQRVMSLAEITTLPQAFRKRLEAEGFAIRYPEVERRFTSVDGTIRYLLRFADGQS